MPLDRISASRPLVTPPVDTKEFPDWFNTFIAARLGVGHGRATVCFHPYNYETGELLSDDDKKLTVEVPDFWSFVMERPTLAIAVNVLTVELGKVAREQEVRNQMEKEGPEALADLQGKLNTLMASYVYTPQ